VTTRTHRTQTSPPPAHDALAYWEISFTTKYPLDDVTAMFAWEQYSEFVRSSAHTYTITGVANVASDDDQAIGALLIARQTRIRELVGTALIVRWTGIKIGIEQN
jgi:hypothetical protein